MGHIVQKNGAFWYTNIKPLEWRPSWWSLTVFIGFLFGIYPTFDEFYFGNKNFAYNLFVSDYVNNSVKNGESFTPV